MVPSLRLLSCESSVSVKKTLIVKKKKIHFSTMPYVAVDEMFLRQLCKMSSRFANPTFLRRVKGILQRCFQSVFYHCLENHLANIYKNCF